MVRVCGDVQIRESGTPNRGRYDSGRRRGGGDGSSEGKQSTDIIGEK